MVPLTTNGQNRLLICSPHSSEQVSTLDPEGINRVTGQLPRKTRPQPGPERSNPRGVTLACVPRLRVIRPLQSGNELSLSGALPRLLVPLQGTTNLPFGLTRGTLILTSRIAAFGYPCSERSERLGATCLGAKCKTDLSCQCFALSAYDQVTFGFLPRLNLLDRTPRIKRPVACPKLLGSSRADCHI